MFYTACLIVHRYMSFTLNWMPNNERAVPHMFGMKPIPPLDHPSTFPKRLPRWCPRSITKLMCAHIYIYLISLGIMVEYGRYMELVEKGL